MQSKASLVALDFLQIGLWRATVGHSTSKLKFGVNFQNFKRELPTVPRREIMALATGLAAWLALGWQLAERCGLLGF